MKYIYLVLLTVLLVGCVQEDPWRAALANERQVQAANSQASTQANIERAQQADTDARNAHRRLCKGRRRRRRRWRRSRRCG